MLQHASDDFWWGMSFPTDNDTDRDRPRPWWLRATAPWSFNPLSDKLSIGVGTPKCFVSLKVSIRSRSREISERQSRGISVFFCGFRDVGSLTLVPCSSTSKSWAQPRLLGGVLSVAIDHGVLGIVPGARCSRASFCSANPIWTRNTGNLQKSWSSRIFIDKTPPGALEKASRATCLKMVWDLFWSIPFKKDDGKCGGSLLILYSNPGKNVLFCPGETDGFASSERSQVGSIVYCSSGASEPQSQWWQWPLENDEVRIGRNNDLTDFNDWVNGILWIYSDSIMVNGMLWLYIYYTNIYTTNITTNIILVGGFKPRLNTETETVGVEFPGRLLTSQLDPHWLNSTPEWKCWCCKKCPLEW